LGYQQGMLSSPASQITGGLDANNSDNSSISKQVKNKRQSEDASLCDPEPKERNGRRTSIHC